MLSDNFVFSAGLSRAAAALDKSLNTLARPLSLADEAHRQLLLQLEMNLWRAGDKSLRHRVANAARAAGNDGYTSFEINCIHGFPF